MFSFKRFSVLIITAVFAVSALFAQNNQREMTVEESYLQESIEMMIIKETARAETRELKFIALEYIAEAIDRGSTNDDIRQTLEFLSLEGNRNHQTRENGRLVNNFPEVRRRAAMYLGQLGTEEAKDSLIRVTQGENEPMVLMEAIRSLGDIGLNDNNATVENIAWVMYRFEGKPDNQMAAATIYAFREIAKADGSISPVAIQTLNRISSDYRYATPVREGARQLVADLRSQRRN